MTGRIPKTRIMAFGTFDVLHKGHLEFFRQARSLAEKPYLIVSVARDSNAAHIKGRPPHHSERERLRQARLCPLVDQAVLGAREDYLGHLVKHRPQVIVLGYDQTAYTRNLRALLAERGLEVKIKRLRAYLPERYKSSLILKLRGIMG